MSTELKIIKNTGVKGVDLQVTQFFGGKERGVMVQLTQGLGGTFMGKVDDPGFIHLTIKDAYDVSIELLKWIKNITHETAMEIGKKIEKNQVLKNTIFKEAIDCERFIEELKIIEIPIRLLK